MKPMTSKAFLDKFRGASVVFFALNAHFAHVRRFLHGCYTNISLPGDAAAELATRDATRLWQQLVAEQARLLALKKIRVFYVPARRPGTFWALNHDDPDATPIRCPLLHAADLLTTGQANNYTDFYMHDHLTAIDDRNVAAFLAAGHKVITGLDAMLGVRIDAYPASNCAPCNFAGKGYKDALHMCLPGAPDYALDVILRQAFGTTRPMSPYGQTTLGPKCSVQAFPNRNRSRKEPSWQARLMLQHLVCVVAGGPMR